MMKTHKIKYLFTIGLFMFVSCALYAQRMQHSSSRGGSSATRPTVNRGSINGGAQRSATRPPTTSRPSSSSRPKTQSRDIQSVRPTSRPTNRPNPGSVTRPPSNNRPNPGTRPPSNNRPNPGTRPPSNNRPNPGTRPPSYNKPNPGYGTRPPSYYHNVRVNNYSRNRYYNGYRGYRPYHYHPYRPYYYGPRYHPFGFFLATMYTTAVIVSLNNQQYHYNQGVYYVEKSGGYETVPPPVNIKITSLPDGVEKIEYDDLTYYYFGGTFYEKVSDGFKVIEAPDGAIVTNIPEGAEEVEIEGVKYVIFNNTYFQPLTQDGANLYQVVAMEEA